MEEDKKVELEPVSDIPSGLIGEHNRNLKERIGGDLCTIN